MNIDFVVLWVDGSDAVWVEERNKHAEDKSIIKEVQYRDWDTFRYWFRAVEKYAPWVNKIHLVTWGHLPSWINVNHPKLNIVFHKDFIPKEYLPTFSANPIELNLHRIESLSEYFVFFNDDVFLNRKVSPDDFFVNGLPCETPIMSVLVPSVLNDTFIHILCNDMAAINQQFDKKTVIKQSWKKWFAPEYGKLLLRNVYYLPGKHFSAFYNFHTASSMRKSTFEEVWVSERDILHKTSMHKFRSAEDVNQYLVSYYNICKGEFVPRRADFSKFYVMGRSSEKLYDDIIYGKHKVICINDTEKITDIEQEQEKLLSVFEHVLPGKSSFEV